MNYIIAAYPGKVKTRPEYWAGKTLQFHLQKLYELYLSNNEKFVKKIAQITIGTHKQIRDEKHKNYYRKKYWKNKFPIPIVFFEYLGPPLLISYGQWIEAGQMFPNFSYSILVEDDYYLSSLNFEGEKDTYLCSLVAKTNEHYGEHASISNGIIDTKILCSFTLENLAEYAVRYNHEVQAGFSFMVESKFPIKSLHEKYNAYFWSSYFRSLQNFSKKTLEDSLFLPLQFMKTDEIKSQYLQANNVRVIKNSIGDGIDALKFKNNNFIFETDLQKENYFEFFISRDTLVNFLKNSIKLTNN